MSAEMPKRSYTKKRRAELEEATRRRITVSAMELHGSVGPARTSVSAVAERAGVRRSTVYRHFADEAALFGACSAHWATLHPAPDPATWAAVEDPDERLAAALGALYAWYGSDPVMFANLLRDEEHVAALADLLAGMRAYLEAIAAGLARDRPDTPAVRAALGLAVRFETWRSLTADGLDDARAVELMRRLAAAAA